MSFVVAMVPTQGALDRAWADYVALAKMQRDDPSLALDRRHVERTLRAHRRFSELFNALEAAA